MNKMTIQTIFTAAVALAASVQLLADVPGELTLRDKGGRTMVRKGMLRWQNAQKQYVLTIQGGVSTQFKANQVADVKVAPPAGWDKVVAAIRQGRGSSVTAQLDAIVKEYAMLQYDVVAGTQLARIYLDSNRADQALKVCESVVANKAEYGSSSDIAPVYWEAMIASGKTSGLEEKLTTALMTAPRQVAARAAVLRGDLLKNENRVRDALKDGYLRAVVLFRDQRAVMPEALYKAAIAFESIQQVQYAEKMRSMLLSQYAESEYARKVRGN